MNKLVLIAMVVLLHLISQQESALQGGLADSNITDAAKAVAKWSLDKMAPFTGIQGTHTVKEIVSVKTQVVAGMNYAMTIIYSIVDANQNVYVRNKASILIVCIKRLFFKYFIFRLVFAILKYLTKYGLVPINSLKIQFVKMLDNILTHFKPINFYL